MEIPVNKFSITPNQKYNKFSITLDQKYKKYFVNELCYLGFIENMNLLRNQIDILMNNNHKTVTINISKYNTYFDLHILYFEMQININLFAEMVFEALNSDGMCVIFYNIIQEYTKSLENPFNGKKMMLYLGSNTTNIETKL